MSFFEVTLVIALQLKQFSGYRHTSGKIIKYQALKIVFFYRCGSGIEQENTLLLLLLLSCLQLALIEQTSTPEQGNRESRAILEIARRPRDPKDLRGPRGDLRDCPGRPKPIPGNAANDPAELPKSLRRIYSCFQVHGQVSDSNYHLNANYHLNEGGRNFIQGGIFQGGREFLCEEFYPGWKFLQVGGFQEDYFLRRQDFLRG